MALSASAPVAWAPPVDVCEMEDAILIRVEAPGVPPEQTRVTLLGPQDRMSQGAPELHRRPATRRRSSDPLHMSRKNFRRLHFQSAAQMAN
jgi:hypothetical protein